MRHAPPPFIGVNDNDDLATALESAKPPPANMRPSPKKSLAGALEPPRRAHAHAFHCFVLRRRSRIGEAGNMTSVVRFGGALSPECSRVGCTSPPTASTTNHLPAAPAVLRIAGDIQKKKGGGQSHPLSFCKSLPGNRLSRAFFRENRSRRQDPSEDATRTLAPPPPTASLHPQQHYTSRVCVRARAATALCATRPCRLALTQHIVERAVAFACCRLSVFFQDGRRCRRRPGCGSRQGETVIEGGYAPRLWPRLHCSRVDWALCLHVPSGGDAAGGGL